MPHPLLQKTFDASTILSSITRYDKNTWVFGLSHTGEFLNMDWISVIFCYNQIPLDYDEFEKAVLFYVLFLQMPKQEKAEYFYPKDLREFGCPVIEQAALCRLLQMELISEGQNILTEVFQILFRLRAIEDGCKKLLLF